MGRRTITKNQQGIDKSLLALALEDDSEVRNALSNWFSMTTGGHAAVPPSNQTAPSATAIVAIAIVPKVSGIFDVSARLGWSDTTTADLITHRFFSRQYPSIVVFSGTGVVAQGILGSGASGAEGVVLGADAAGGAGILVNSAALFGGGAVVQGIEQGASLTGLLSANANAPSNFGFTSFAVDASGGTNTRTPFVLGEPVVFGIAVTATHVVEYGNMQFSVAERPFI